VMVLVTQGAEAACAAKATGARAEARRRRVLVNCIVEVVFMLIVGDCLLRLIRVMTLERANGAGENECDSSSVEIKRMTLLRGRQEDLKRVE
jgi:hypothetical protein